MPSYGDLIAYSEDLFDKTEDIERLLRDQAGQTWASLGNPPISSFRIITTDADESCVGLIEGDDPDYIPIPNCPGKGTIHRHMGWKFVTI